MPDFVDIVSISMLINNKQTIISGIYKSPNSDIKRFSDFIYNNFSDFSVKGDLFLVGDFNVNILIKNSNNDYFIDTIFSMGCFPLVTKPTRYGNSINSLIDNIYCNITYKPVSNGIVFSDISDHLPIFVIYDISNKSNTKHNTYKYIRKLNGHTIHKFKCSINAFDWKYIYSDMDLELLYDKLINDLVELFNLNCPIIKVKEKNKNNKPWLYNSLIKCINKKNKMYKKMIKNKSFTKINYYKKYKNILTSLLRLSEKLYYSNKINNNKNNIKYTWSIINNLINPNLGKKGNNSNSPNANEFNTFFSNIGINLSEKISAPSLDNDIYKTMQGNKFNIHINNICSKAYVISNIIFRCFTTNNSYYLVKAYTTYIRPLLEYGSSIWNPGNDFSGLKKLIEKVQHKFTKRIYFRCNFIKSTYDTRLCFLNLMNLSHRRLRADLILAFKILNNLVDIDKSSVFTTYSTSNRGPLIKIRKDKCINKSTINSFSNRVSTAWNSLPRSVASSKCLSIFITNIDTININGHFYSQHA